MKIKNIILGLFVSIMAGTPALKAMEKEASPTINTTSSTSTVSNTPESQIEEIKKHENPYKTGFWDQLLHNPGLNDEEKLKKVEERISRQTSLCELFIGQLNEFIRKNVKNNSVDQKAAKAIKSFFVDKLEKMEAAYFEFSSRMDAQEDKALDLKDESYGYKHYSGKLNGKPKEQAEYALGKYLKYREMKHFIKLFPIDPPVLNPILAKTIMQNVKEITEERSRLYEGINGAYDPILKGKHKDAPKFNAVSEKTCFVKLNKEDTLSFFIDIRYKKWRDRLDHDQKMKIFTQSPKSLADSLMMIDHSASKLLILDREKKQD